MIPERSLNEQWVYAGMPGTGKSWKARIDTWKAAQQTGGYFIAHDPTESFEDDGVDIPHQRYDTPAKLIAGVRKHGGSCVHILDGHDGDTVLRTGKALAAASMAEGRRKAAKNPLDPKSVARKPMFAPVFLYWDEAVASSEENGPRRLTPLWMDLLGRRRRYGIVPVMTTQSTFFSHRSVLMMCSRVYAFRLSDPEDAKRLRSVGLTRELGETLPRVPDRMFYEMQKGRVVKMPSYLEPEPPSAPPPSTGSKSPQDEIDA